jgi:hypothetical protein
VKEKVDALSSTQMNKLKELLETAQCQELTCFYVCMRQGCGHQPMVGVLDDAQHQCVGHIKHRNHHSASVRINTSFSNQQVDRDSGLISDFGPL